MGLILGPLIIFWIAFGIYSLTLGYSLLSSFSLFPDAVALVVVTIFTLSSYLNLGLKRFKSREALWWAEIPFFFVTNKPAIVVFIAAVLFQFFGSEYLVNNYLKSLVFIVIFVVSFGAIIGTFGAEAFMQKHNIKRTH